VSVRIQTVRCMVCRDKTFCVEQTVLTTSMLCYGRGRHSHDQLPRFELFLFFELHESPASFHGVV